MLMKALILLCSSFAGCAAAKPIQQNIQRKTFWAGCEEVRPTQPDDSQHWICVDVDGHSWDVQTKLRRTQ